MSDEQNELIERPSFLAPSTELAQNGEMLGMEQMGEHHQIAYMKIVQSSAKPELKEMFGEGDAIVTPQMMRVIQRDEKFHFVPLYAFTEYTLQNPIQAKGLPFIRERTFDRESDIAKRARSRSQEDREETCPEAPKYMMSYVEHLNYVLILLDNNDAIGMSPVVQSFFKSEWKRGMSFNSLMRARRKSVGNICGCRFQATISLRRNDQGSWYGFDIVNPEDGRNWIDNEAEYNTYVELQRQLAESFKDTGLVVDYGDNQTVDAVSAEAEEKY